MDAMNAQGLCMPLIETSPEAPYYGAGWLRPVLVVRCDVRFKGRLWFEASARKVGHVNKNG